MQKPYWLLVSAARTVKVEVWPRRDGLADVALAVRGGPSETWGPPERMESEPILGLGPRVLAEKVEAGRARAGLALAAYRGPGGVDPDDLTAIGDLIADLLHLAEGLGMPQSEASPTLTVACDHYEYESDPDNREEAV